MILFAKISRYIRIPPSTLYKSVILYMFFCTLYFYLATDPENHAIQFMERILILFYSFRVLHYVDVEYIVYSAMSYRWEFSCLQYFATANNAGIISIV